MTNWQAEILISKSKMPYCQTSQIGKQLPQPHHQHAGQPAPSLQQSHQQCTRITYKIDICVRDDQLAGRDPDRELDEASLPNQPPTKSCILSLVAPITPSACRPHQHQVRSSPTTPCTRITYKICICVKDDQLAGRDPDREVE